MKIREMTVGVLLATAITACGGEAPEPGAEGAVGATTGASADADSTQMDAAVTADTQALPGDTSQPIR